jgi:hypothetical protein
MKLKYSLSNINFECEELRFYQYKNFLKGFYGNDVNLEDFLQNFIELFSKISNKPQSFFQNLSIADLFLLLIQLRIYTLGPTCQIVVKTDEETAKKSTITLNLEKIKQELLEFFELQTPCYVAEDNIKIKLDFPSASRLTPNDSIESYIKECIVIDKNLENITNIQANEIFNKLSAKLAAEIFKKKQELVTAFISQNYLASYQDFSNYYLGFDLSIKNLLWYCKLFFNETLETLFDNLFYLSYIGHFNLQYLEQDCTPGEYVYFIKKLNSAIAQKGSSSNGDSDETINAE